MISQAHQKRSHRASYGRPRRVFLAAFVVFFAATALWSLETPLISAPDEQVQVAKAAAVVRGELVGHLIDGPSSPNGIVTIPAAYANLGYLVTCYQFNPNIPASCAPPFRNASGTVPDIIYDARYQPLYYAIVGIPSLFTDSALGIYLMRLVSAALSAIFLALAVMAVVTWSRSRLLLAGIAVAATPSVLFFAGVVNPSGLEISIGICLWTSLLILARERLSDPPGGLVALVAISGGIESLVRSMSPFWVVLIFLVALAVADWSQLREFLRLPMVWAAGGFTAVCGALGTAWVLAEHSLNVLPGAVPLPAKLSEGQLLVEEFLRTAQHYTEMVSRFGWLSAPSPDVTYLLWAGLLGLLLVLAFATSSIRPGAVLVLVVLAVVVIPMVVSASQARRLGIIWQGKDTLPFAVGVPILASSMIATSALASFRALTTRLVAVVAASAGVGTLVALWGDLRRNAVGDAGPALSFVGAKWQPPLSISGTFALGLFVTAALVAMLAVLGASPAPARSDSLPPARRQGSSLSPDRPRGSDGPDGPDGPDRPKEPDRLDRSYPPDLMDLVMHDRAPLPAEPFDGAEHA